MQQTKNYGLNIIEPSDTFNADALNDNAKTLEAALARLDAAVVRFACGSYTGDGKNARFFELGFTPKMVYVGNEDGAVFYYYNGTNKHYHGGLALEGKPVTVSKVNLVEIVDGGFQVDTFSSTSSANYNGREYRYFAIG